MTPRSAMPKTRWSLDWRLTGAAFLLLLVTLAVYAPVLQHAFVEWDDPSYVTENAHVRAGLSASGIIWAFTSTEQANWHPLTWLSHMLDVSLFGLAPWGHHLTSLLLHLANTVLLFVALRCLTGSRWRSLGVAALFALHPLHVESVAWIAERKDVLSTAFWFVTLWAYARFAEKPTRGRYALVALGFALGLMAKPMLVSLPLTLLILDGWPLRRAGDGRLAAWWPLVVEKLPLFALSLAASITTLLAQGSYRGAITDSPLATRVANAALGYFAYLEKTVWPVGLSAFYPYRPQPPLLEAALKAAALVLLTAAILWFGRRRPYLKAGWLWYVVTLVPVIGLVRVGQQAIADRYTYVPLVGVFVMFAWGAADLVARLRMPRVERAATGLAAVLLAAVLAVSTNRQVATWKNGVTLWEHVLALGGNSTVSHNNLGVALQKAGRLEEAASHDAEAIRLEPRNVRAHANLGSVRFAQGRFAEAIQSYEEALRLLPEQPAVQQNLAMAHYNLANSLWRSGNLDAAVREYREALRSKPGDAGFHRALGMALIQQGHHEEAVTVIQRSLEIDPENPSTHDALAVALYELGDYAGARRELEACRTRGGTPTAWLVTKLEQQPR